MKVYIVIEFSYDWYEIVGAYSTIEKAKEILHERQEQAKELQKKFGCDLNEFVLESVVIDK